MKDKITASVTITDHFDGSTVVVSQTECGSIEIAASGGRTMFGADHSELVMHAIGLVSANIERCYGDDEADA